MSDKTIIEGMRTMFVGFHEDLIDKVFTRLETMNERTKRQTLQIQELTRRIKVLENEKK